MSKNRETEIKRSMMRYGVHDDKAGQGGEVWRAARVQEGREGGRAQSGEVKRERRAAVGG